MYEQKIYTEKNLEFWIEQDKNIIFLHAKTSFVHMYTWFELKIAGTIGLARHAFQSTFRLRYLIGGSELERV